MDTGYQLAKCLIGTLWEQDFMNTLRLVRLDIKEFHGGRLFFNQFRTIRSRAEHGAVLSLNAQVPGTLRTR